ncbi:hypothetical protein NDU88_000446 [Pleurodeles waltl]|uniref:Uncharacterized protein n=1 Tax=Pleurodeles waltl TaxID=8319 RepID=A0AAV7N806_PLEWA|nr:hypothetical protein NDU88_000446 [Pleurodeles waltl]
MTPALGRCAGLGNCKITYTHTWRPRRAPERAPRQNAARGQAVAVCHPEGRRRRGCGVRGESGARRGGIGPGTGDPGEDSLRDGSHGGPTHVGPRPLDVADPAAWAAALRRRALGRWACGTWPSPLRAREAAGTKLSMRRWTVFDVGGELRLRGTQAFRGTGGCNCEVPSVGMEQPNNR